MYYITIIAIFIYLVGYLGSNCNKQENYQHFDLTISLYFKKILKLCLYFYIKYINLLSIPY